MDIKRHVQELRENITNNWTSTGQELSRELRQYWPASRPQSPARFTNGSDLARSPTTPGATNSKEFITGYSLGLVGGVRSWVCFSAEVYETISNPTIDDQEPAKCARFQPPS